MKKVEPEVIALLRKRFAELDINNDGAFVVFAMAALWLVAH